MNIPRKVQVGDKLYSVEVVEMMEEKRRMGRISYADRQITLGKRTHQRTLSFEEVNEAFWHETTHAILDDMGHSLRHNELFVTAFARRLARAVLSSRVEK